MTNNNLLNFVLEANTYTLLISILWVFIKSKISIRSQRFTALAIPILGVLIWAIKPFLLAKDMVYTNVILAPINVLTEVSILPKMFHIP